MSAKNFVSIKLHSKLEFKRRTTADSKIFIKANSNINTQLGWGLVMSSPCTKLINVDDFLYFIRLDLA